MAEYPLGAGNVWFWPRRPDRQDSYASKSSAGNNEGKQLASILINMSRDKQLQNPIVNSTIPLDFDKNKSYLKNCLELVQYAGLSRECLHFSCLPEPSFADMSCRVGDMSCRVGDMSATCLRSCRRLGDIECWLECLNDTTFEDMSGDSRHVGNFVIVV